MHNVLKINPANYCVGCGGACTCWAISTGFGGGGCIWGGGGIPCMTSGFIGGGMRALRTRKSIILYHSRSTPAFSCSAVICCRCPSSFSQARRQLTLPCSSTSKPSSGPMGNTPGMGGGNRGSGAIIGKLGLKLIQTLDNWNLTEKMLYTYGGYGGGYTCCLLGPASSGCIVGGATNWAWALGSSYVWGAGGCASGWYSWPGGGCSTSSEPRAFEPFDFFLRTRWTPVRGSTFSLTVQYEPFPRSVRGRGTFSKHGFSERLWRTEFCKRYVSAETHGQMKCLGEDGNKLLTTNRDSQTITARTRDASYTNWSQSTTRYW